MLGPSQMILYPGRKVEMSVIAKQKSAGVLFLSTPHHGFDGIEASIVELPYDAATKKATCPCGSDLKFKDCCSEPREIAPAVIEKFEKKYRLGKYQRLKGGS